jgi:hypothetical protein
MKRNTFISSVIVLVLFSTTLDAQKRAPASSAQAFLNSSNRWEFFDGNRIVCTISNYGPFADYMRTNSSGFFWPKGRQNTAIYSAGIWIAGIHRVSSEIRTAIQDYSSEYQPGPIKGLFHATVFDSTVLTDPSDVRYRVYKIKKGDNDSARDYREWPSDLGAPYVDINNNSRWDPGIDRPWNIGSQTLWSVYNDGNPQRHALTGNTVPMGLEVRATYYGFDHIDFLRDVMFLRWTIINKSDAHYDSTFFGLWHDADLGDANDDCVGVDTSKWISYVYNGDNEDTGINGYDDKPPAVGFVYLQTPVVSSSVHDSGLTWDGWRRALRNVEPYAFMPFFNSWNWNGDPWSPGGDIFIPKPLRVYRCLSGVSELTGEKIKDPLTQSITTFPFAGDPVDSLGWIQTITTTPRDMRGLYSVGPIILAPGDTQEVTAAIIVGQGSDRLKSITSLRLKTDLVKEFFNSNYTLYQTDDPPVSPPPVPQEFFALQNFPNPFNPITTIVYAVPNFDEQYPVSLKIFNVLGMEVASLVNEYQPGGEYNVEWNAGGLSSGIYFYRLSIAGSVASKKMLLMK